jgi:hypothetical protein
VLRVAHVEGECVGGGAVLVIGGEGEIDDGRPADFDDVRVNRDVRLRVPRLVVALAARRGRTPARASAERLAFRPAGARKHAMPDALGPETRRNTSATNERSDAGGGGARTSIAASEAGAAVRAGANQSRFAGRGGGREEEVVEEGGPDEL